MTSQELTTYLDDNQYIECADDIDSEQLCFRNNELAWYQNNPEGSTAVKYWKVKKMSDSELTAEINRGLQVEGITRITGYFTKISSWNPGKLAELKDRKKFTI